MRSPCWTVGSGKAAPDRAGRRKRWTQSWRPCATTGMASASTAYVDSCIHISAVDRRDVWQVAARSALAGIKDAGILGAVSALVVMECLVMPFRDGHLERVRAFDTWFEGFQVLPLDRQVLRLAAELRASTPAVKTPDAIHVACAIHHGCDEFWTNDDRGLVAAANGRIAIRTLSR
ncbi:MAG: type II toxin-antitoxin system VapC family toxin [Dehalococcoidia bacterium]